MACLGTQLLAMAQRPPMGLPEEQVGSMDQEGTKCQRNG